MNNTTRFHLKYIIAFCLLSLCIKSVAQQPQYLGTKTPYHPQQATYTKEPEGYTPVFINYVGRHGARFLTSAGSDVLLLDVLQQAKQEQSLTKNGNAVLELLIDFEAAEKDNYGNITLLGKQEQHDIAARMQQQYQPVFQKKKLLVEMTEKVRTQQSAQAFLSGLKGYDTSLIQSIIFPSANDNILRFYDLSPAYDAYLKNDAITAHIDSLKNDSRTKNVADVVCKKIFTASFINQLNEGKISTASFKKTGTINTIIFTQALYDVYSVLFSAIKEMKMDDKNIINTFQTVFTKDDLCWLDKLNSAEDFFEKGPAADILGIQVTIASPLLRDLIATTDSCIKTKNTDGIFRFTHAEAISPLATLMDIPQASQQTNSVYNFYEKWNAYSIIPLSANIQWIIYRNSNNYLIKVLLNEKEVALPISTSTYPYYKWDDVKDYYTNKLAHIKK